jgi:hypothetical protein
MMNATIVFHMAMAIAPRAEYTQDAHTIITTIARMATSKHEAAKLLIQAWRESRFKINAVGDKGKALGAYQLHRAPTEVLTNIALATRITIARLRESETLCPAHPLVVFAKGNCQNKEGIAISDARMKEVEKIEMYSTE